MILILCILYIHMGANQISPFQKMKMLATQLHVTEAAVRKLYTIIHP